MGERVEWNGRFVIIDNYLILQGEVRSLFFNFENRKVASNIMEFPEAGQLVIRIEQYPKLQNIINMALYAFGKWGTIKGIKVEQDYQQLNHIFSEILQEYHLEPAFARENYRFYKDGIRITYEDIIQIAIETADKPTEEEENPEEEEQGLWHKLVWKKQQHSFSKVETTLMERQKERLGHNFYMVGYLCPSCKEKLHMVVYPVGKEQKIETEEGGVYLARAYTCNHCNRFYTPVPEHLIQDGSVYEMAFGSDRVAYEDYLELLGENGDRTSNYNYNEYAAVRNHRKRAEDVNTAFDNENEIFENADEAWLQMEAMCRRLRDMPEKELNRFLARIEDGFYPDVLLERHEEQIARLVKERKQRQQGKAEMDVSDNVQDELEQEESTLGEANSQQKNFVEGKKWTASDAPKDQRKISGTSYVKREEEHEVTGENTFRKAGDSRREAGTYEDSFGKTNDEIQRQDISIEKETDAEQSSDSLEQEEGKKDSFEEKQVELFDENETKVEQIRARMNVWDRMSPRQRQELKKQIQRETQIKKSTRRQFLQEIKQREDREVLERLKEKVENCRGKAYAIIKRVLEEVEQANIPGEEKRPLLEQLRSWLMASGTNEVEELMKKMPQNPDRKQFKTFMKKIREYEGVDLSPYEEELARRRENVEGQEAANMVKRARKNTRSDLVNLMKRMEEADFEPETLQPYMDDLMAQLQAADQKAIDAICEDVMHMDFNQVAEAYEKIDEGNFLPQLKTDALNMLSKRLAKIKTDECESLVQKLKDDMSGKIRDNERHHFYPARKVLMKNATEEELAVIDYALGTYAGNRGLFEYPILVVDTSRNGSGKEGMILTSEHIFTSTLLNAFYAPIKGIRSIKYSTGLLNKGIWIEQKNGTKIKVPFAVENDEIKNWAEILLDFIKYLQEKPESRNLQYLAKEKHDTICCFRCGHVYKGGNVCPECGYKSNK